MNGSFFDATFFVSESWKSAGIGKQAAEPLKNRRDRFHQRLDWLHTFEWLTDVPTIECFDVSISA